MKKILMFIGKILVGTICSEGALLSIFVFPFYFMYHPLFSHHLRYLWGSWFMAFFFGVLYAVGAELFLDE